VTVLEAIQKTAGFFAARGIESARLEAELLLAHVLGVNRMKLYLAFDRALSAAEVAAFRELVRRRGQRQPLQHLVGTVSFCGLELAVSPAALIPRPETEELARLGWEFLAPRAAPAALDWGTGTGCLAIALAVNCPAATLAAVDVSEAALALARANVHRHQLSHRVTCFAGDGFAALPASSRYDLLISNPPYIPTAELAMLQPEVRDHDPRLALEGGPDGLEMFRRLAAEAGPWLKADGRVMLEFGDGQAAAVARIFHDQNWVVEAVLEDYSRRARFLVARRS